MTILDLTSRLQNAAADHAERPMFSAGRITWSYGKAWDFARRAAALAQKSGQAPIAGFYCNRDETAYLAILSIICAGRGYVPLNPKLPDDRLITIAATADIDTIFVGKGVEQKAAELFAGSPLQFICLGEDSAALAAAGLKVFSLQDILAAEPAEPKRPATTAEAAYLLFTSGSTGAPKGVAVSHANLGAYLDYICPLYKFGPQDVHSQTFELTFDLSVHDMMCAWTTGGHLIRIAGAELMSPGGIVRRQSITSWFSVPSLGSIMARTGGLKPASLPSLRVSLFCGEAFPASLASQWTAAAPNSIIENLYGPTEATIAFTRYQWNEQTSPAESAYGIVPIGKPFDGQAVAVIDDEGNVLKAPCKGMLFLGGSQVTGKYWKAPDITAEKYRSLPGLAGDAWYDAGDIVEVDERGCIHFVGRADNQIKFRGYRIELREVEDALRKAAGTELAVALPWPKDGHEIKGITAVIAGPAGDASMLINAMRDILPEYMLPQTVRFFDEMPRNMSGKIDRNAILARLDREPGE